MPFQTWECKPDIKAYEFISPEKPCDDRININFLSFLYRPGSIFFSLTAAVISIELTITDKGIILNSFQGGTSSLLQDTSDKVMSFVELKHLLCRAGVNLFPDEDAFCYCDGNCTISLKLFPKLIYFEAGLWTLTALCEKDFVTESHLYECMAQMGLTHNFMWSRWNNLQNSRTMVLLIRELIEKKKTVTQPKYTNPLTTFHSTPINHFTQPTFSTLIVTPLKAYLSGCTEVSASFTAVPLAEINGVRQKFHADLYHLGMEISQPISHAKQNSMDPLLRDNFLQVLKSTRPLSLS